MDSHEESVIIARLKRLSPERLAAVQDYIDFLAAQQRAHELAKSSRPGGLIDGALINAWGNGEEGTGR